MRTDVLNSMFLSLTSHEEIHKLINNLLKKSPGPDGITGYLLKMSQDVIIPIFTDLFNKCMRDGVFPDVFKNAQITPLFKDGDETETNNYRHISLLSQIAKLFETNIFC